MNEWISIGGLVISFLASTTVLVALLASLVAGIIENIANRRWDACQRYLTAELEDLSRWCSYEFPVIEDVSQELILNLKNGGTIMDRGRFRAKLRAKYKSMPVTIGERKESPPFEIPNDV